MSNVVAVLDIGSSKVCALIAEVNKGQFSVLGVGTSECRGVKKGIIVDIDSTVEAIISSVKQAENMSNIEIKSVYTNIYSGYATILKNKGIIAVTGDNHEIGNDDIRRVIEAAKVVAIPSDKEIVDIIPEQFIVDGSDGVRDPRGMSGVRLEVDASIVAASSTTVQNIIKSINRAGFEVDGIVLSSLGSSKITLSNDERTLGAALVDVGAETTDIAVFKNGELSYTKLIPVGGYHITNDISMILKIPMSEAEKIKKQYGVAIKSLIKNDDKIKVNNLTGRGDKEVILSDVAEIMEARIFEILELVKRSLLESGYYDELSGGVVITGGGLFNIKGMLEAASMHLNIPVRFGYPNYIGVANPVYSVSAGIAINMLRQKRFSNVSSSNNENEFLPKKSKVKNEKTNEMTFIEKVKDFFSDFL